MQSHLEDNRLSVNVRSLCACWTTELPLTEKLNLSPHSSPSALITFTEVVTCILSPWKPLMLPMCSQVVFRGRLIFKGKEASLLYYQKPGHQVYEQPSGKIHFIPFDILEAQLTILRDRWFGRKKEEVSSLVCIKQISVCCMTYIKRRETNPDLYGGKSLCNMQ